MPSGLVRAGRFLAPRSLQPDPVSGGYPGKRQHNALNPFDVPTQTLLGPLANFR
jgi:hypothetical protein